MRAVSPKRAKADRQYAKLRRAFLHLDEDGRPCELCEERQATEVHHRRGRVGALYLLTDHWSALCRHCHAWATENPTEAIRVGISEPRIGRGVEDVA
jgi:hypothetical protein